MPPDPLRSDLPRITVQHQAWPNSPPVMKAWQDALIPEAPWSWLGQLARRAYLAESTNGPHNWSTVETLLTQTHAAWAHARTQGVDEVLVNETTRSRASVWPRGPAWDGSAAQRRTARTVLRALGGFHGHRRKPFDVPGRTEANRAAQTRCLTLALDLLPITWPGWDHVWFQQAGFNAHPAFFPVLRNQPEALRAWLDRGLTPGLRSDGRSLLQEAAWQDHPVVVALLLEHGARPNERRANERLPLQHALAHDRPDVFDRLRAHGARWPSHGCWVNPKRGARYEPYWETRPIVMEVALWSQRWAWQRWANDHPAAFAALDVPTLAQRFPRLWREEMAWANNPGLAGHGLVLRDPLPASTPSGSAPVSTLTSMPERLVRARARQAQVLQEQALRQALLDVPVPPGVAGTGLSPAPRGRARL